MPDIFDRIAAIGVIPVIAIEDEGAAVPLADALAEGGLPVAEITFRTPAAAACIRRIRTARPDFLVGAGTVLSQADLAAARDAGALYGLAPGLDPAVVASAQEAGLPFVPGVMTPSDIQAGLRAGVRLMKFFPASIGGPALLASMAAPFAMAGVGFIPTGGVTQGNLADWLAIPAVRAIGGSWIATRDDIADRRWPAVAEKAAAAVAEFARIRGAA